MWWLKVYSDESKSVDDEKSKANEPETLVRQPMELLQEHK